MSLVIRTPGGGAGCRATHSHNLKVWYAHVPGLEVVALPPPDAAAPTPCRAPPACLATACACSAFPAYGFVLIAAKGTQR